MTQPHESGANRPDGSAMDDTAYVSADGDMTCDARVAQFFQCSLACLKRAGRLILDVRGVMLADTKLIAVIIAVYRQCRLTNVELVLHLPRCIETWLNIYQLDWIADASASAAPLD